MQINEQLNKGNRGWTERRYLVLTVEHLKRYFLIQIKVSTIR
jgi:hypothetical protein